MDEMSSVQARRDARLLVEDVLRTLDATSPSPSSDDRLRPDAIRRFRAFTKLADIEHRI